MKLSILCLYGRLFGVRRFPISVKIIVTLTIGWLISFLFATFFQVWPIWCNWIICQPTTNYPVMYVLCSVTDIVLDVSILCLPAYFIRNLQMNRSRKVGITAIFGLGVLYVTWTGSACFNSLLTSAVSCVVSSIARLVYTVRFMKANAESDWAANFNSMSSSPLLI